MIESLKVLERLFALHNSEKTILHLLVEEGLIPGIIVVLFNFVIFHRVICLESLTYDS